MNELEQSLIIKASNGNIREAQEAAKAVLAANTLKKDKLFCESYLKRLNTTLDCNSYYHWRENRTIAGEDAA